MCRRSACNAWENLTFATLVKKEVSHIIVTHCFLRRHALASKIQSLPLKEIFSTSVKVVNFIRTRALNRRIFTKLCQEMGTQHEVLFVSYRSLLVFKRSSFEAFDGTEKGSFSLQGKNKILFHCNLTARSFSMA